MTEVAKPLNRLLASLPGRDLALLQPFFARVSLARDEMLYEACTPMNRVFFLESGFVVFFTLMEDGAAVESAVIGREGAVGLIGSLGTGRALRRVVMQAPGDALVISAEQVRAASLQSRPIRKMILRYGEISLSQVFQTVACNARHTIEQRFCRWLLQCRDRTDSPRIHVTQEALAGALGVQRTSITAVARAIQEAGLIRYQRGVVEILDHEGLEKASCECYRVIRSATEELLSPEAEGHAEQQVA